MDGSTKARQAAQGDGSAGRAAPMSSTASPYGEWRIELAVGARASLARASQLRLAFKVRWYEHTAAATGATGASASGAMFGSDPCTRSPTCFVAQGEPVVTKADCASLAALSPTLSAQQGNGSSTKIPLGGAAGEQVSTTDQAGAAGVEDDETSSTGVIVAVVVVVLLCFVLAAFAYHTSTRGEPRTVRTKADDTASTCQPVDNVVFSGSSDVVETALASYADGEAELLPVPEGSMGDETASRTSMPRFGAPHLSLTTRRPFSLSLAHTHTHTLPLAPLCVFVVLLHGRFVLPWLSVPTVPNCALHVLAAATGPARAAKDSYLEIIDGSNTAADAILALHSVGQMSRGDADQLLHDTGVYANLVLPCRDFQPACTLSCRSGALAMYHQ